MAVRRLSPDQPKSFEFTSENAAWAEATIAKYPPGKQASAVYVVRPKGGYGGMNDVLVDLRVDDHPEPVTELRRLLDLRNLYFGTSPASEKLKIEKAVLTDLRRIMKSRGFYLGDESGPWDGATEKALDVFIASENFEERVDLKNRTIDAPVLAYLRGLS